MDRHQQTFVEEARELLTDLEESLLAIEHDTHNTDLIGKIFRAMHTIKGSSSMFGFDVIAKFTHQIENAFDQVREGKMEVTSELISLTLDCRDHIAALLDILVNEKEVTDEVKGHGDSLLAQLRVLMPVEQSSNAVLSKSTESIDIVTNEIQSLYRIRFRPPENIYLRGLDPQNLLAEVAGLGECEQVEHTVESLLEDTTEGELCHKAWDILLTTSRNEDVIRDVFIFVEEDSELRIEKICDAKLVTAEKRTVLLELLRSSNDAVLSSLVAVVQEHAKVHAAQTNIIQQHHDHKPIQSIKVPAERLDKLVNLVGELVTVQARLTQAAILSANPSMLQIAEEVESLIDELRDNTLSIRMLPIGTTFARFVRLVRDLSSDLGKEIQLLTEGEETELDKTVIERLADPMVHMIRNSIDHGIETPDERERAGKPRVGTIRLSAVHSGANVHITISDDGKGFDTEQIRKKAISLGLLAEDAEPTEQEILAFVFAAGFSTAKEVTSVSGRGVGMDVVKRSIENLNGQIEVSSKKNKGTTIVLKLPLTLAIIEGLLVKIDTNLFVLPLSVVKECVELPTTNARRGNGGQMINVRGEIIPYVRLRDYFSVTGNLPQYEYVVIAEVDGENVGFAVDVVLGEHQTVVKSLGTMYKNVEGVSGATILGDGTIALIVDIPVVINAAERDRDQLLRLDVLRSKQITN